MMDDVIPRKFWLELRGPRCVPERKGPFPAIRSAEILREFMAARPETYITVVTIHEGVPDFQDGPQCLQILDGRSMKSGAAHIRSTDRAHSRLRANLSTPPAANAGIAMKDVADKIRYFCNDGLDPDGEYEPTCALRAILLLLPEVTEGQPSEQEGG